MSNIRLPHRALRFAAVMFTLVLAAFSQQSSNSRLSSKQIAQSLTSAIRPDQAAISPDGSQVAWVQPVGGPEGPGGIFVVATNGSGTPQRITAPQCSKCNETGIAWSPDSKQIAFLSDTASSGQSQLYLADLAGRSARKLTSLTGYLGDPKWSRDGKQIAFLFTENAPRTAGPLAPMTPPSGVIDSKVFEQRLTVISAIGGEPRQLSPAEMYIYEYDWSPDNNNFAVIAAPGSGDANWYIAQIYTLPAAGGALKPVFKPNDQMQIAVPRWSPDGRSIAFIGGLMSDEGSTGGDIYTVSAAGGDVPRDVTPRIQATPTWLQWTKPD